MGPESTSATLGDHDPELFNFWKQIHEHEDQYEVALARPLGIVFEEIAPLGAAPAGVKVIEVSAPTRRRRAASPSATSSWASPASATRAARTSARRSRNATSSRHTR